MYFKHLTVFYRFLKNLSVGIVPVAPRTVWEKTLL